jgi:hypothetical protein
MAGKWWILFGAISVVSAALWACIPSCCDLVTAERQRDLEARIKWHANPASFREFKENIRKNNPNLPSDKLSQFVQECYDRERESMGRELKEVAGKTNVVGAVAARVLSSAWWAIGIGAGLAGIFGVACGGVYSLSQGSPKEHVMSAQGGVIIIGIMGAIIGAVVGAVGGLLMRPFVPTIALGIYGGAFGVAICCILRLLIPSNKSNSSKGVTESGAGKSV